MPDLAAPTNPGRQRDVLPHRLNPVIEFGRDATALTDVQLEQSIAVVVTGMRESRIALDVGNDLLIHLFAAFRSNAQIHNTLVLLRESGMEVAQREVERLEAMRRQLKEKSS